MIMAVALALDLLVAPPALFKLLISIFVVLALAVAYPAPASAVAADDDGKYPAPASAVAVDDKKLFFAEDEDDTPMPMRAAAAISRLAHERPSLPLALLPARSP